MSDMIEPEELRDAVRPVLTDLRDNTWPVPGEDGRGMDEALWQQCAELGWLQLSIPEDRDGLGLGIAHLRVVYEEMGRSLGSVPYLSTMLAVEALSKAGAQPGVAAHLEAIAAGKCRAAVALADTHASLEVSGEGKLSGRVADVLFADVADILLLPVRNNGQHGLAILPAGNPAVEIRKRGLIDLTRSSADVAVSPVDAGDLDIIELDAGMWAGLLDHAAVGLACDSTGATEALFDLTLEYLNTREQFGRLIGSFQALKHRAADWKCRAEVAAALARQAAMRVNAKDAEASATASGAKFNACDLFAAFSGDAIQLHGGIGFTWEHPCHLFLKRAKLNQQLFGNSTFHKERVARLAFDETIISAFSPDSVRA